MKEKKGFTLIELLIVISIIGLLATLSVISLTTAQEKARDAKRKDDIKKIQKALEYYYMDEGEYPASGGLDGIPNAGWSNSAGSESWENLRVELTDYIELPIDPQNEDGSWQHNYGYYSLNRGCSQQWYMLVYKLEDSDIESPGAKACDGSNFNFGGTITTGICPGCSL